MQCELFVFMHANKSRILLMNWNNGETTIPEEIRQELYVNSFQTFPHIWLDSRIVSTWYVLASRSKLRQICCCCIYLDEIASSPLTQPPTLSLTLFKSVSKMVKMVVMTKNVFDNVWQKIYTNFWITNLFSNRNTCKKSTYEYKCFLHTKHP